MPLNNEYYNSLKLVVLIGQKYRRYKFCNGIGYLQCFINNW